MWNKYSNKSENLVENENKIAKLHPLLGFNGESLHISNLLAIT